MIRVLYADDDPNVASVVRSYFEHFGPDCTLETVPNGRICLEKMAQGGYDVLLLDLMMPEVDGLHVLGELAARGDPTPVVLVSGHGQNEMAVRALRAGAVDCVDKSTPQFLQVVDIVKRVHARHLAQPARPASLRGDAKFRVLLAEGSMAVRSSIEQFFRTNAPNFDLTIAPTPAAFDQFLADGAPADAVIIGPNPGTASPLDPLRLLHSRASGRPVVLLSARNDGETAIAAFKLGAQDYLLQTQGYLTDLVFSLNNILRRADIERRNTQLTAELGELNRSLETQVLARTAELRELSNRLLKIQEDERRAIARELHDQVGQMLTGLKFQLEAAARVAGPAAQDKLTEALATSTDLLRHVRELTQHYRPRILDDLGIQPALEWHATQFYRQTDIAVSLDLTLPAERLPGEVETVVFRFVQEALTNVARHSGATKAEVTVTTNGPHLIIEVTDRGKGFDAEAAAARSESIGLAGLRERVQLAGGRFEIFSKAGQGTRVQAEIPLPPPVAATGGPAA